MTDLRKLLARAIPALAAMYRSECDEATLEVWHMALDGEEVEAVQAVLRRFLREPGRRFMPTTNEVVEALHGNPEDSAVEAWPDALESIRTGRPTGDDLIDDTLRAMGGLADLGSRDRSERQWTRKDFLAAYQVVVRREKREELPKLGGDIPRIGEVG